MLIVDDILFSPVRGLLFVFQEIHKAVLKESENEADAIRTELSRLYLLLESEQLTEDVFGRREKELLDRLDNLEASDHEANDPAEEGDDDDADQQDVDEDVDDEDDDDHDDADLGE